MVDRECRREGVFQRHVGWKYWIEVDHHVHRLTGEIGFGVVTLASVAEMVLAKEPDQVKFRYHGTYRIMLRAELLSHERDLHPWMRLV